MPGDENLVNAGVERQGDGPLKEANLNHEQNQTGTLVRGIEAKLTSERAILHNT